MGWHYILRFNCKLLPEHIQFIENKYLMNFTEDIELYRWSIPERTYPSDDERSKEEKNRIEEWKKEKDEEFEKKEQQYESLPKFYKDLIDIWRRLDIGHHFYEYELRDGIFYCEISKKVNRHEGDLRADYESFLKDIIVPISSEITDCEIESDDYGDMRWYYSDSQLRNIHFRLEDKIKRIEHVYSEDGNEIYETKVIYKHSIKRTQFLDLNRAYGRA